MGQFQRSTNGPGAIWANVLLTVPFLQPVTLSGSDFIFGGLVPSPLTNRPPAAELLNTVLGDTNLVAYDWELTGPRIDQWLHFGQLVRFALHLAQVPPKSASFAWLTALEPKLGGCVTAVSRTGPAQLSFVRRSGLIGAICFAPRPGAAQIRQLRLAHGPRTQARRLRDRRQPDRTGTALICPPLRSGLHGGRVGLAGRLAGGAAASPRARDP